MQHKRKLNRKALAAGLLALTFVAILISLMFTPMPAPKQMIEKQLDTQALLNSKPNEPTR